MLKMLKILIPRIFLIIFLKSSIGKASISVTSLSHLESTQIRKNNSFFFSNTTGANNTEMFGIKNPWNSKSLTMSLIVVCLSAIEDRSFIEISCSTDLVHPTFSLNPKKLHYWQKSGVLVTFFNTNCLGRLFRILYRM